MRIDKPGVASVFDLSELKPEHFDDLVGQPIAVVDSALALKVVAVERLKSPSPRAQPFSLILQAPANTRSVQGIYQLQHPQLGVLGIFLVPIAPQEGFPQFEAVFN